MIEIVRTDAYQRWFSGLRDLKARVRIRARLQRVEGGALGDVAPVGAGVSELRLHYGPGYRLYFVRRGARLIVLLGGGDKSTQKSDIARAIALASALEIEP